jgi:hypothetical protein
MSIAKYHFSGIFNAKKEGKFYFLNELYRPNSVWAYYYKQQRETQYEPKL